MTRVTWAYIQPRYAIRMKNPAWNTIRFVRIIPAQTSCHHHFGPSFDMCNFTSPLATLRLSFSSPSRNCAIDLRYGARLVSGAITFTSRKNASKITIM